MNGMNWRDFVDAVRREGQAPPRKSVAGVKKAVKKLTGQGGNTGGNPRGMKRVTDFLPDKHDEEDMSAPPGAPGGLEEEVEESSFDIHDTLEPGLWADDELKEPLRDRMLKIAKHFMSRLPIEVEMEDVRLTGSLANYNWSNYSDVDLHIVVDFLNVDENRELVKAFFDNARMKWNDKHNIRLKGYDVEIYVEDSGEQHHSSGVYSVLRDEWINKPTKYQSSIDFTSARRKADDIEFQVNIINNLITTGKLKSAMRNVERLKRKIKNMRRAGLESSKREFSVENIAFKILRRNGILDQLENQKNKIYDETMSMPE
tara:strand:+ start:707 stop:1651 length:945 start_codon:yes stop_codon:yes gene_type:complete